MKSTHAFIKKRIFKEKRKVPKWMVFLTYLVRVNLLFLCLENVFGQTVDTCVNRVMTELLTKCWLF